MTEPAPKIIFLKKVSSIKTGPATCWTYAVSRKKKLLDNALGPYDEYVTTYVCLLSNGMFFRRCQINWTDIATTAKVLNYL